jgi:RHS repeat-associated protein
MGAPVLQFSGVMPAKAPLERSTEPKDLVVSFSQYDTHGRFRKVTHPNSYEQTFTYEDTPMFPGGILKAVKDSIGISMSFVYGVSPTAIDALLAITAGFEGETPDGEAVPPVTRDRQTPHREQLEIFTGDDEMDVWQTLGKDGQIRSTRIYKPGLSTPSQRTDFDYYGASDEDSTRRGRLKSVNAGQGLAGQSITYHLTAGGGEIVRSKDEKTGVVTEAETDAVGQTVRQVVKDASGAEVSHEVRGYDASGRLVYVKRRQKDVGSVEETLTYDVMGRVISRSMTNAAVDGTPSTVTRTSSYTLNDAGVVISEQGPFKGSTPSGPETTTTHDKIGRPVETRTTGADGSTLLQRAAYDIGGNPAYVTDTAQNAILSKYDLKGRLTESVRSDGITTKTAWTPWNQREADETLEGKTDAPEDVQAAIARTKYHYTNEGRLRLTNVQVDGSGQALASWNINRGGALAITKLGLAPSLDEEPQALASNPIRTERVEYDFAGRETKRQSGFTGVDGVIMPPHNTYLQSEVTSYKGAFPTTTVVSEPRAGASFQVTRDYDGLGRVIREQRAGEQSSLMTWDEAGNLVAARPPGMKASTATYDARGLAVSETRPDGSVITRTYDALGNLTKYRDEAGRETLYSYDGLGRPTRVTYPDATFERTVYAAVSGEVTATRERAGQWLVYHYDERGWLAEVRDGGKAADPETDSEPDTNGQALIRYTYDAGGRVTKIANKDAAIEQGHFDLLGRPSFSRMVRYKDGSGLGAAAEELDRHAMEHRWNVFGEITEWRMPASGVSAGQTTTPAPGNAGPWLGWINEEHDPAGNLVRQSSMETGTPELSEALGRGFGRVARRSLPVEGGNLTSWLGYADGSVSDRIDGMPVPSGASPFNGMLGRFEVASPAGLVAGSEAGRDAALRLKLGDAASLGSRRSVWGYDDLGRLTSDTILALKSGTSALPTNTNGYIAADFRHERAMAPRLGTEQLALLESKGFGDVVPGSWTAASGDAHAVEERTIMEAVRDYLVTGARRASDGVWTIEYDALGRMTAQQREGENARRIEYQYGPNDRVVGRIAKQQGPGGEWILEMRSGVLARDGLPADATFVWDPITDRLLGIYRAGADSFGGYDPNAGLVRQFLHGDQGYDDPIEVRALNQNPTPGEPGVFRWFPVADPLSGGSITAVLDERGRLVERVLYADSYGDAPRYLQGPVVDMISVNAEKDGAGNVRSVRFEIHLSESVDASTLAEGARLEAVQGDGRTSAASAAATPELIENHTIRWTLSGEQWQQLVTAEGAASLKLSLTGTLRAEVWGNAPVMPPSPWAQLLYPVRTTTEEPVFWLEQLSEVAEFFATIPSSGDRERVWYAIPDLYLAASPDSKTKLLTGFKAAPFVEPATGLAYFRARWYDPSTGTFLTPDPMGYHDSSNLYAAFGGDPVNRSDPDGQRATVLGALIGLAYGSAEVTSTLVGDCFILDECKDSSHYLSRIGMYGIIGAELGASLEFGNVGGSSLGFALGGAGLESLGAAEAGDWSQFGESQALGAAMGVGAWSVFRGLGVVAIPIQATGKSFRLSRYSDSAIGKVLSFDLTEAARKGTVATLQRLGAPGSRAAMLFRGSRARGQLLEDVWEAELQSRRALVFNTKASTKPSAHGIDFGAVEGSGTYLDEVKFFKGRIPTEGITSLGLNRQSTLALNLQRAVTGARAAEGIPMETIAAIQSKDFTVRLIGGPRTVFDQSAVRSGLRSLGIERVEFHRIGWTRLGRFVLTGR